MSKEEKKIVGHPKKNSKGRTGLPQEFFDEVDHFHSKKDQVMLEENGDDLIDSDGGDYNPDTILDLPSSNEENGGYDDEELFEKDTVDIEGEDDHNWGRGRKNYYSNDREEEEAQEAERLYKKKLASLTPQDFGVSLDRSLVDKPNNVRVQLVDFESEDDILNQKSRITVETIEQELEKALKEVREVLQPFMDLLTRYDLPNSAGLSFLQIKYNLLIHFCINSIRYIDTHHPDKKSAKKGRFLEKVEKYRRLIENIKPLEAKLEDQINGLLKITNGSKSLDDINGTLSQRYQVKYRKEPAEPIIQTLNTTEAFSSPDTIQTSGIGAIKHESVCSHVKAPNQEPHNKCASEKEARNIKKADISAPLRFAEGEKFVRFHLSKKEKRKLAEHSSIADQQDDLNDIFDEFNRRRQNAGATLEDEADIVINPKMTAEQTNESDAESETDDDYYEQVRAQKQAMAQAKASSKPQKKVCFREIADMKDSSLSRPASKTILVNRGLTPARPKDTKNPRVKQRVRYERATKRLGSFRAVSRQSDGPYRGESTGIRSDISKSLKY